MDRACACSQSGFFPAGGRRVRSSAPPPPRDGADRTVVITPAQLGYLLEGIDWRLPQQTWRPQAAG
jgi:hypothetical protein